MPKVIPLRRPAEPAAAPSSLQRALTAGIEAANRLPLAEPMLQPPRSVEEIRRAAPTDPPEAPDAPMAPRGPQHPSMAPRG